jgi:hypothetical protein
MSAGIAKRGAVIQNEGSASYRNKVGLFSNRSASV